MGFWDKPPGKDCCKSTHTSVEEEDGRESKMQDHMRDRLDKGKDGDAPCGEKLRGWKDLVRFSNQLESNYRVWVGEPN